MTCASPPPFPPRQNQESPGPFGPGTPKRVRKESERRSGPGEPQSPQRVCHGVRKESTKSPKLRFWTLFGLRGALFGDSGASPGPEAPGHPFGLFSDSLGFRARRARETSVPGRRVPKVRSPYSFLPILDGPAIRNANRGDSLRGPAATLFISRDTCSDSIAEVFRAYFYGYRTTIARYVAKWGIAQVCL